MGEQFDRGFAWLVLGSFCIFCLACAADSWRQLGRSTRIELYGQHNEGEMDLAKGPDVGTDGDSIGAAVSFDALPWLAGDMDRERDEWQAAALARAFRAAQDPLPFEQAPVPPSESSRAGGEQPKPFDGPPGTEAGVSLPWYVTPTGITALSMLVATVVGVWQRQRIGAGVEHIKRRVTRKKPPDGA